MASGPIASLTLAWLCTVKPKPLASLTLKCICNEKFDIYFFAFYTATLYRDHNAANQMIISNLKKSYKPSKLAILAYRTRNRAMVRDVIPRIREN